LNKRTGKKALQNLFDVLTRPFTFLVISIAIILIIRLRLLGVPFERDEGEYAYSGWLILKGITPFSESYNMKFPGIYFIYAIIMLLFGTSINAIHFGLLISNISTGIIIFSITNILFSKQAGLYAAITFLFLSMSREVQGLFANAEHFVILFSLAGIIMLLHGVKKQNSILFFFSGILLALAAIIKQHGIFFIPVGFLFSLLYTGPKRDNINRTVWFIIGLIIPAAILIFYLSANSVLDKFWFWTVTYSQAYISQRSLLEMLPRLIKRLLAIMGTGIFFFSFTILGLAFPFRVKQRWTKEILFLYLFFLCSFLAVLPGFHFRPHYFILLLPALSFFAGVGFDVLVKNISQNHSLNFKKILIPLVITLSISQAIYNQKDMYFSQNTTKVARLVYGPNPFPEAVNIARYIKNNSNTDDKIAIIGSEPQIPFYAKRRSATGYMYTYALMEKQPYAMEMQKEFIAEIESAKPEFVVFVNISMSWLKQPDSVDSVFVWFDKFSKSHYQIEGLINILSKDSTNYCWGSDAKNCKIQSPYWLAVFRRHETK